MTPSHLTWIQCAEDGCTRGLGIRPEHVDNFDGRAWHCPEHKETNR